MTMITIEEAQAKLPELIAGLSRGDKLTITQEGRIVGERSEPGRRLAAGFARGVFTIPSDDDDHLKDFAEYMP